jgi:hypothetical protein
MKAEKFLRRFSWLLDLLKMRGGLTIRQIDSEWRNSSLNETGGPMDIRTFHRDCDAIQSLFGLDIVCDRRNGYTYSVKEEEGFAGKSTYATWLLDTFTTINRVSYDKSLEGRIMLESVPSGHQYLSTVVEAVKVGSTMKITYQKFGQITSEAFEIEPYGIRLYNRRWYVIARNVRYHSVRIYSLDRIKSLEPVQGKTFTVPEDFDINNFFSGCVGINTDSKTRAQRIVLRAHDKSAYYLESLPIHSSQKVIGKGDGWTDFEYFVKPTFEFYQQILAQAGEVEVREPDNVKRTLKVYARKILSYYPDDSGDKLIKFA